MSTASIERELNDIERRLDLVDPFAAELGKRSLARQAADKFRSLTTKARQWFASAVDFLHLGAIRGVVGEGVAKVRSLVGRVLIPVRKIGWFNIAGAMLTCQKGREITDTVVRKTASVATLPVRMAWKPTSWLLRKVGLSRVVDWVENKAFNAEYFVCEKYAQAMDWLDEREHAGAMRWARSFYQAGVTQRAINSFAPTNLRTPLYIGSLFVPNLGVGGGKGENKLSIVVDTVKTRAHEVAEEIAEAATPVEPVVTLVEEPTAKTEVKTEAAVLIHGIILGSGKKVRLQKLTAADGVVTYRYNGRTYAEGKLPGNLQIEDQMAAAEATPMPNRAARRAAGERGPKAEATV